MWLGHCFLGLLLGEFLSFFFHLLGLDCLVDLLLRLRFLFWLLVFGFLGLFVDFAAFGELFSVDLLLDVRHALGLSVGDEDELNLEVAVCADALSVDSVVASALELEVGADGELFDAGVSPGLGDEPGDFLYVVFERLVLLELRLVDEVVELDEVHFELRQRKLPGAAGRRGAR